MKTTMTTPLKPCPFCGAHSWIGSYSSRIRLLEHRPGCYFDSETVVSSETWERRWNGRVDGVTSNDILAGMIEYHRERASWIVSPNRNFHSLIVDYLERVIRDTTTTPATPTHGGALTDPTMQTGAETASKE